jgi:hypothetical protein
MNSHNFNLCHSVQGYSSKVEYFRTARIGQTKVFIARGCLQNSSPKNHYYLPQIPLFLAMIFADNLVHD